MQAQAIVEQRAPLDLGTGWRDHCKMKPRRRQALQIAWVGEKSKHPIPRRRQVNFAFKLKSLHDSFAQGFAKRDYVASAPLGLVPSTLGRLGKPHCIS